MPPTATRYSSSKAPKRASPVRVKRFTPEIQSSRRRRRNRKPSRSLSWRRGIILSSGQVEICRITGIVWKAYVTDHFKTNRPGSNQTGHSEVLYPYQVSRCEQGFFTSSFLLVQRIGLERPRLDSGAGLTTGRA